MSDRIDGNTYRVTDEEIESFHVDGYVHLKGLLTADEVDELETVYDLSLIHI